MIEQLRSFLTPPVFDTEDKTRRARLLHSVILVSLIAIALYALAVLVITPESGIRLALASTTIPTGLLCLTLVRRGNLTLAGVILSGLIWIILGVIAGASGGVGAPAAGGQIITIVVATLAIGWRGGVFFTLLSVAASTLLYLAQSRGLLPEPLLATSLEFVLVSQILFFGIVGGLVGVSTRYLERTLKGANAEIDKRRGTEKALRKSETNFAEAQRIAHLGSWEWNIGRDFLAGSDEFYRIFEIDKNSFEASRVATLDLIHPDDFEFVNDRINKSLAGEGPFVAEYRILTPSGELKYIYAQGNPDFDDQGNPIRFFGTTLDITDIKRLEEAHSESEGLYKLLAENSSDVIWTMNMQLRWTYVSPSVVRMRGFTPEEVIAQSIGESVTPESFKVAQAAIGRIVQIAQNPEKELDAYEIVELEALCKDGSTIWTEQKLTLLRDEEGQLSGIVGVSRDISAKKEAEEMATRLGRILDDATNEVYIVDTETLRFLQTNRGARENLGYSADELLSLTPLDLTPDLSPAQLQEILAPLIRGEKESVPISTTHRRKDGSSYSVEIIVQRSTLGPTPVLVGIANDVTERLHLEDQLRQSQKMEAIGRLAGGVAHDFNNLLTAILGNVELLEDTLAEHNLPNEEATEIHKAAERAAALTNQLLAFSRKQIIQTQVLDLNEVVAGVNNLLGRLIGEDIALVTELAPEPLLVRADPSQLEQALVNLAVNSRDAMPEGGKLTIATANVGAAEAGFTNGNASTQTHYAVLEVRDTGVGMHEEVKSKIFEPFFTTKDQGKGTGLGLSMVYGMVKQNAGNIHVESDANKGTSVRVFLPIEEEAEPSKVGAKREVAVGNGTETILLVEDEAMVRRLAKRILEGAGYRVFEAEDAESALDVSARHSGEFDLLLTDVILPKMKGPELAMQFQETDPDIRMLFMSGYTDHAAVIRGAFEQGINFIQKPFTREDILDSVRQVLDAPVDASQIKS